MLEGTWENKRDIFRPTDVCWTDVCWRVYIKSVEANGLSVQQTSVERTYVGCVYIKSVEANIRPSNGHFQIQTRLNFRVSVGRKVEKIHVCALLSPFQIFSKIPK